MISPEQRAEIRRLFFAEHWKVGTIATQLGVHHDTVSRAIEVDRFVSRGRHVPSQLDPYLDFIGETLEQYPKLRATRIHEMIVERGYRGSVVQTRRAVKRLRPKGTKEAFLRLQTLPGEQAQVDWGCFGHVTVGKARRALSAFVMVLTWSRAIHVLFTLDQTLESFLRGHVAAFDYFGGVARTLLYDNLKSVVLERSGTVFRFHPRLLEFCAHYHYRPQPVGVGRGNEKGGVERQIRFLRDRFFAARRFADVDDLNAQFVRWRQEWAHARPCPGDDSITVAEALDQERERLLPLPAHPFSCDKLVPVKTRKTPYVRFDTNDYSFPADRVGRVLTLAASDEQVRILDGDAVVAVHDRSYDRKQRITNEQHIAGLLEQKRAARLTRGRGRLVETVPNASAFLEAVVHRGDNLGQTTRQLLGLLDDYGPDELGAALDQAVERGTATPASVAHLLEQSRRRRNLPPPIPVELPDDPRVKDMRVKPHNLEDYDGLAQDHDDDQD